jgi:hypothetical protein
LAARPIGAQTIRRDDVDFFLWTLFVNHAANDFINRTNYPLLSLDQGCSDWLVAPKSRWSPVLTSRRQRYNQTWFVACHKTFSLVNHAAALFD